ncbi:MAG: FtsB family cell division protein [Candidatus Limivicinus sp.]|jgi:cell division protein DivIC
MQTKSILIRIAAVSLLLYTLVLLGTSLRKLSFAEQECRQLRSDVQVLRDDNGRLKKRHEFVESDEGMERLARERLGLVMPGEKIYYFMTEGVDSEENPDSGGAAEFTGEENQ